MGLPGVYVPAVEIQTPQLAAGITIIAIAGCFFVALERIGQITLHCCTVPMLGYGCRQDPARGKALLEKSEKSRYKSYGLGMMYAEGIGVREDIEKGFS